MFFLSFTRQLVAVTWVVSRLLGGFIIIYQAVCSRITHQAAIHKHPGWITLVRGHDCHTIASYRPPNTYFQTSSTPFTKVTHDVTRIHPSRHVLLAIFSYDAPSPGCYPQPPTGRRSQVAPCSPAVNGHTPPYHSGRLSRANHKSS